MKTNFITNGLRAFLVCAVGGQAVVACAPTPTLTTESLGVATAAQRAPLPPTDSKCAELWLQIKQNRARLASAIAERDGLPCPAAPTPPPGLKVEVDDEAGEECVTDVDAQTLAPPEVEAAPPDQAERERASKPEGRREARCKALHERIATLTAAVAQNDAQLRNSPECVDPNVPPVVYIKDRFDCERSCLQIRKRIVIGPRGEETSVDDIVMDPSCIQCTANGVGALTAACTTQSDAEQTAREMCQAVSGGVDCTVSCKEVAAIQPVACSDPRATATSLFNIHTNDTTSWTAGVDTWVALAGTESRMPIGAGFSLQVASSVETSFDVTAFVETATRGYSCTQAGTASLACPDTYLTIKLLAGITKIRSEDASFNIVGNGASAANAEAATFKVGFTRKINVSAVDQAMFPVLIAQYKELARADVRDQLARANAEGRIRAILNTGAQCFTDADCKDSHMECRSQSGVGKCVRVSLTNESCRGSRARSYLDRAGLMQTYYEYFADPSMCARGLNCERDDAWWDLTTPQSYVCRAPRTPSTGGDSALRCGPVTAKGISCGYTWSCPDQCGWECGKCWSEWSGVSGGTDNAAAPPFDLNDP